ncbi:amidase family protein [Bradyrhizobium oligotrophicum S58]
MRRGRRSSAAPSKWWGNTAPTCLTGHPAISIPVGKTSDGRPIGAMLIARHLDEMTLYRAAAALEACYQ